MVLASGARAAYLTWPEMSGSGAGTSTVPTNQMRSLLIQAEPIQVPIEWPEEGLGPTKRESSDPPTEQKVHQTEKAAALVFE